MAWYTAVFLGLVQGLAEFLPISSSGHLLLFESLFGITDGGLLLTLILHIATLLAVVVGLVPNCAASVVLTELYLMGGLRFGALLGGLCVNAGLGLIFLLRQKHLWREKLFVISWLIAISVLVGYSFLWLAI